MFLGISFAPMKKMADLLIVDDEIDIASPLRMFLESEGHHVRYAENGRVGLKVITEKYPDVVLLDVEMPELTGPDMAARLFVEDCGREYIRYFLSLAPAN